MAGAAPGGTQRASSKFIVFENFEKMNTAGARQGLAERELAWQENLQAIAPNKMVTIPAIAAAALATIPATILSLFDANISGTDYVIAFTTDGAGYGVNLATGSINNFAPPGTFFDPDLTSWQAERVLINDALAGYCTWDGTIFVRSGTVSPVFTVTAGGSGYSTAPPVTITGGSGTGATAHSVISNGVVVAVVLDSPGIGYNVTDVLTVTFGVGVGAGATGHVTMSGFTIGSIGIQDAGNFNPLAPGTYALTFTGGGGAGAAGTATVAPGPGFANSVHSVQLTNPGSGYTSAPTVDLPGVISATPPVLVAFLDSETVASIVLDAGGAGYVAPPNVSIQGGSPTTAATAHSTISAGAVNALILDTAGAGYQSTPIVVIGTGSGAAATGRVWPFIPGGTTIAVFQGRVWLGADRLLQYTGTLGFDDFDAANAAGSLLITDPDLVHAITVLRAANNYLFIMGDQSVKQIGNISLNAAGTLTLFTILTLSSDQGTIYRKGCISFNRVFMFANKNGIYAVFGSSVQKISDDLDGIWPAVNFSQEPQAALIDMNGIHNVGYLVRYADPFTATTRSVILTFNGKRWFVISQGALRAITTTSTLASGQTQVYGSAGTDITQLFADPTTAVSFRLQTSLSHHGNGVQGKKMIRAGFAFGLATGTGTIVQKVESETQSRTTRRAIKSGFHMLGYASDVSVSGVYLGETLTGTLAGLTLTSAICEYQDTTLWWQTP